MIDSAIRAANHGLMRRLTDLSLETIRLDGHASALWQKRLNRLAALPWMIEPATGEHIDSDFAEECADLCREQLNQIPNFRQCLMDLNQGTYHGRACSEIDWDLHKGRWRARDLYWVHARRLSFGPNRDLRVIDLRNEVGDFADVGFPVEAIPYKFVVYKPRQFGDYSEREGLAPRTVFWSFFSRLGTRERLHLMEIFGKPWRIAVPRRDPNNPNVIDQETIDNAWDALNRLGGHSTAVLPYEMDVMVPQPAKGAGDVHKEAIEHAQLTLSKLYLGSTGTTDAVSTGLGSSIGDAHLSEEDLIIASDAWRLSEVVENQLVDPMVILNFGPDAVDHAPRFRLATDPPMDRAKEAELLLKVLDVGIDVSLAEARERLGVREITDDEPFLRRIARNINGQIPMHLPLPEVIYPQGANPARGQIADIPFVEGARAPGLGEQIEPPALPAPDGGGGAPPAPAPGAPPQLPSPDDGPLTDAAIEYLADKMTEFQVERCQHGKSNRCPLCGIERMRDFDLGDDGSPQWKVQWRPIGSTRSQSSGEDSEGERMTPKIPPPSS